MAFKQPRVPEYRESEGTGRYLHTLVLFLKDFCMDVWTANNQRTGEIDAVKGGLSGIHYPVTSVCGKTGDVTLTAGDVGALAADGTASDSRKLGGNTMAQLLLTIYPVGSVYLSLDMTSPASLFGGTWESIGGRFLLGADSTYAAGSTGGEETHTLTIDEMPAHRHAIYMNGETNSGEFWGSNTVTPQNKMSANATDTSGGNHPHNNMPPYLAVYMWKRVS